MRTFRIHQEIDASPTTVWEILANVVAWPHWLPTVSAVEPLGTSRLALGEKYRVVQPKLRHAVWQVSELNWGRSFIWEAVNPGLQMWANHLITAESNANCNVTLEFRFSGLVSPLVALLTSSITERYLATEAASLKALAEHASRSEA